MGWPRDLAAAPYRLFWRPLMRWLRPAPEGLPVGTEPAGYRGAPERPERQSRAAAQERAANQREEPEMAKSKRKPRLATRKGKDGQHYNRVVAANNRTLMSSEGFGRKDAAENNEEALVKAFASILRERGWKVIHPDWRSEDTP